PGRVIDALKTKLPEIGKLLPPDVELRPYYSRDILVKRTVTTVLRNLVEGAGLVMVLLSLFLYNVRAALIVALTIPLSLLFAFVFMDLRGVPSNLLSLGAIDFGIIVDGAVIMAENILRRLSERKVTGPQIVREVHGAAVEVARPLTFAVLIIMTVYVPILTFQRIEGKLFRPMALTISLAVIGSLLLTLTVIPVLSSLVFRRPPSERESPLLRWLRRPYQAALAWCLRRPLIPVLCASGCLVVAVFVFALLGKEFLPELDEGDLWVRAQFPTGISVEGVRPYTREIRERLLKFPEVRVIVSQLGAPDDGTDPEGPDNVEFYVGLKAREEWANPDKDKLIEAMRAALADMPGFTTNFSQPIKDNVDEALAGVPGFTTNFSQPIKDNVDEALAGVKGELAIKLYGPDIFVMDAAAREIVKVLRDVPGVTDLDWDHLAGLPQLQIIVDRAAAARYGINVRDIQDVIEAATKGRVVTQLYEGERRFDVAVRLVQDGDPITGLRNLTISAPSGERIPVTQLAEFIKTDGVSEILREGNVRRLAVKWSVRDRDMGSLVTEAMQKVGASVRLPDGYRMVWSGRFEDQQRALARLYIIVPLVLFIIFVLLFGAFQSVGDTLLIMLNLPFALIGGTLALYFWRTNFNISAAVGYIAVFGVSVLNGVVLLSSIRQARQEGCSPRDAIARGCEIRFRPIVVSAVVAVIGFLPAALSQGIGAEIQRPLARVVIGGLISSTALTLLVLPAIYALRTGRSDESDPPPTEPAA
ncbi:MAG: CusA/CzcA family heavy metal efflux RND transporter, partial [Candidatus Rokuibacteriota bacterium]